MYRVGFTASSSSPTGLFALVENTLYRMNLSLTSFLVFGFCGFSVS